MKKLQVLSIVISLIAVFILFNTPDGLSKKVQPPTGRTGAPSETTCASCHSGSSGGTGNIAMIFSGVGNTYVPDSIYTITVTTTDASALTFGFEITALTTSNQPAGTLMMVGGDMSTTVQTVTSGMLAGRIYVGHHNASTVNTWTALWQAPSNNIGDVKFYYTGIGANGNNSSSGDKFYQGNSTITFGGVGIKENVLLSDINFQNPASASLNLNYTLVKSADVNIDLYDVSGKKVLDIEHTHCDVGDHNVVRSLHGVTPGLYVVRFNAGDAVQTTKILVL